MPKQLVKKKPKPKMARITIYQDEKYESLPRKPDDWDWSSDTFLVPKALWDQYVIVLKKEERLRERLLKLEPKGTSSC